MKFPSQSSVQLLLCTFFLINIIGCSSLAIQAKPIAAQPTDSIIKQNQEPIVQKPSSDLLTVESHNANALLNIDVSIAKPVFIEKESQTAEKTNVTETSESEPHPLKNDGLANTSEVDLWQHLKKKFRLEYSDEQKPAIEKFERWYAKHPKYFERLAERAYWLLPFVLNEVEKRGMPAEIALLPAIESAFRHEATSRSHAVGLWQIMGATGRRFGLRQDWWMDSRRDMVHSTRAALDYLEYLSREFDGDWFLALAGYNAGEGNIRKQMRRNRSANKPTDYWSLTLRRETQEYVPKLLAVRNIVNDPGKFNIKLNAIPAKPTLAVIDARIQTDLTVAASLVPISAAQLHSFNLGYKRGVTPPTGPHNIVVPIEYANTLLAGLNTLTLQQRMRWARHQVRKGEYLGRIARKHGVTVNSIIAANQLSSSLIQPGQELKIPISTGHYQYAKVTNKAIIKKDGDTIYTIKSGDTLWEISLGSGASLSKLLRWNGLTKRTLLHPGQKIIIGRPI